MYVYKRRVQYHETDKMGITHHSNYIKWMEEARADYLDSIGLPYQSIEAMGVVSPVVSLSVEYKSPSTFGDEIAVELEVTKYTGAQLEVSYIMKNSASGALVAEARSKHCFLKDGKIVSLKRCNEKMHGILAAELKKDADPSE